MGTIRLPNDFKELLALLDSEKVEYLLVGGYAVGLHGYPRGTGDMDIWYRRSAENVSRLLRTLERFGFSLDSLPVERFARANQVIRFGSPPLRVDLVTDISGGDFDDFYSRREMVELQGVQVSVVSLEDLKRNKAAAGRAKDRDDLENLCD